MDLQLNNALLLVDYPKFRSMLAQPPSPTPTELHDPEPDKQLARLNKMGIKVHDFAFKPTLTAIPATEIYNYQEAFAEYDFIIHQNPRHRPVPGKTLCRLLDLGFIPPLEQSEWLGMDWDELRKYDARKSHCVSIGVPGNGIRVTGTPSIDMRKEWLSRFILQFQVSEQKLNKLKNEQNFRLQYCGQHIFLSVLNVATEMRCKNHDVSHTHAFLSDPEAVSGGAEAVGLMRHLFDGGVARQITRGRARYQPWTLV